MSNKHDIKSLTHEELKAYIQELGQPLFRVKQIENWLFKQHVSSFNEMTNLSKNLREKLDAVFFICRPKVLAKQVSIDGTRKYLLQFDDGVSVETVGIPSSDNERLTVCFSTQAGCAMGCIFCATGTCGFLRNLTSGEILAQIQHVARDFKKRISNVVAMGQGEPFANYDEVIKALHWINSDNGLEIGARHITVSSCGIISGINKFKKESEQYTLAISLHSAIQETRDFIMPNLRTQKLSDLKVALKEYGDFTKRRPSLEYVLIKDINDDNKHLNALVSFCHGMLAHVNLIPLNPVSRSVDSKSLSPSENLKLFEETLQHEHIDVSIRNSKGADIDGACGQLKQRTL